MEIGFDKEIDALLRKARGGGDAAAAAREAHIDADSIAAFAEDALPTAARVFYIKHFADCDRCRRILANVVSANAESEAVDGMPAIIPLIEKAAPWYSSFFGKSGLAVAFASLILIFGGVLVVLVLQKGREQASSSVAKVEDYSSNRAASAAVPSATAGTEPSARSNMDTAAPAANLVAPDPYTLSSNVAVANGISVTKPVATPVSRLDSGSGGISPAEEKKTEMDDVAHAEPRPVTAAPPPPPVSGGTTELEGRSRKMAAADKPKTETDDERRLKSSSADSSVLRAAPAPPAKSGQPSAGPMMNQTQQMNKQAGEMSVTRNVGGRSFNYRDGVWYDTSYRSQATANYRRGTEEFSKLDGGIRSIANTLGGTVVVIWKGKAYRIQ